MAIKLFQYSHFADFLYKIIMLGAFVGLIILYVFIIDHFSIENGFYMYLSPLFF